jgi:oligopeptide/dipeptide ABC transporter ATP-binding protein
MSGAEDIVLETHGLAKRFDAGGSRRGRQIHAVNGIDFTVHASDVLSLVGESGCGKTTTGRMLVGLERPTSGSIRLEGRDVVDAQGAALRAHRRRAQLVFQDPYSSLNPRKRIRQIVGEPLRNFAIAKGEGARSRIVEVLETVGLDADVLERFPHEFSGGQRQRIGLARALVVEPAVLVLDEPVSALDVSVQAQVINLLKRLRAEMALSIVLIAHDLAVVRYVSTHVAVMYLGRIIEIGRSEEIFAAPRHPYTRELMAAIPNPDPDVPPPKIAMRGEPPSPTDIPTGCPFHPRCRYAADVCHTQPVALEPTDTGQRVACHRVDEIEAIDIQGVSS